MPASARSTEPSAASRPASVSRSAAGCSLISLSMKVS